MLKNELCPFFFWKVTPGRIKQAGHRAAALSAAWPVCGSSVGSVCCLVLEAYFQVTAVF